jgi:hypothetical protein
LQPGIFVEISLCSLIGHQPYEDVEKNGNHPLEELAKLSYKSDMEYKSLINLVYLWLHTGDFFSLF